MSMIEVLRIGTNNNPVELTMHTLAADDSDTMRRLVGGWLEAIYPQDKSWAAFCDEDGKRKDLPINVLASLLAARAGWVPRSGDNLLLGPVLFLGPPDANCDATSVPEAVLGHLRPENIRRAS